MTANFESELQVLRRRFQERAGRDASALNAFSMRLDMKTWGSGGIDQVRRIAHGLSGAAGTFGFPSVSEKAAELDKLISNGATETQLFQALRALIADLKQMALPGTLRLAPKAVAPEVQGTAPELQTSQYAPHVTEAHRTVLVLASEGSITSLVSLISSFGYSAITVSEPGEASELVNDGRIAALVMTDEVEGWQKVARTLSPLVPSLLITSSMTFHDRLLAARLGFSGVLPQPYDVFELGDWLDDLTRVADDSSFSILIIEDDPLLATNYALELQRSGMRTEVVYEASEALERLAASSPDLVLLDFQLPGVNGLDLARIIRQSRRDLWLPIVFVSAEKDPVLQLEARRQGGDDFISKPVNPQELVSIVRLRANRAAALRSLMERDSLTGLLNHARFKDRLYAEVERCRRSGAEVTLAMIDVDKFKTVNDTYGHQSGDRVLRALAHTLTAALRRIDVVGRYGGEEFAVILLDTPPAAAEAVIDRIREAFAATVLGAPEKPFSVTFSAGLAGSKAFPRTEDLILAADAALYLAKGEGRNRVERAAA